MIVASRLRLRLLAFGVALLLGSLTVFPLTTSASSHLDLSATLELPRGDIDFELDPGRLEFFDVDNAPLAIQVIDGCAINGHYWILGAGLSSESVPLTVVDRRSGQSQRVRLPAFDPDQPIRAILETEGLPLCREVQSGGLPALSGVGTYTSAVPRCFDSTDAIELLSDGRDDAYRTLIRNGTEVSHVVRDKPISVVDDSTDYDELHLLAEGRTPRKIEGIVISGIEGMLPAPDSLDRALKSITGARIRRAFETAKSGRVPKSILEDLGVKGVECTYHISLDLDTLGADAYLAEARWIKEGGRPLDPPQPVEDRFTVEVVRANGESTPLPLIGPFVGSRAAGTLWQYGDGDVRAEIADACALSGSFWTIAATETDEPLELVVTDMITGTTASLVLWTDRAEPAWLADTSSLPICS